MLINNLIEFFKLKKLIKNIIEEEDLLNNLSKLFSSEQYKVNFKQDWIGRIYAVVNPIVQDPDSRIFEYNINGTNLNSFVNKWVIEHMIGADNFVKNHDLFDILIYNIKQIDDDYNFLITLTPIAWPDLEKSLKHLKIVLFILLVIAIITGGVLFFVL